MRLQAFATIQLVSCLLGAGACEKAATPIALPPPPPPPPPAGCGNTTPGVCYYVATRGHDANPGTAAQPLATIQHPAHLGNPGDGVLVGDGGHTGGAAIGAISRSGTATERIV